MFDDTEGDPPTGTGRSHLGVLLFKIHSIAIRCADHGKVTGPARERHGYGWGFMANHAGIGEIYGHTHGNPKISADLVGV